MQERKEYTLSAILGGLKKHIDDRIKGKTFWLKAEIANARPDARGHYYLTLHETKDEFTLAQCPARIWQGTVTQIRQKIGSDFENVIKAGHEVLCLVELSFSEVFGLSVIIKDIDLGFNLGAIERRKQETLLRLSKEELLERNKKQVLPVVIQKIAIVGSPNTAGIADLLKQLQENTHGYHFDIQIFDCSVQGERAESEIIQRLQQLRGTTFDVIALIRGGGSPLDLDVFNSYQIAREIALHDRPVFTGIGHEIDFSVCDRVAHIHHKTPTALGSFVVERAYTFDVAIRNRYQGVIEHTKRFMEAHKHRLRMGSETLRAQSMQQTQQRRGELHMVLNRINAQARQVMAVHKNKLIIASEVLKTSPLMYTESQRNQLRMQLELIRINTGGKIRQALDAYKYNLELIFSLSRKQVEHQISHVDNVQSVLGAYHPENVLSKGYGIPRYKGKLLRYQNLLPNDQIEIELHKRIIIVSFVKEKESLRILEWKTSPMNKLQKN